MKNRKDDLNHPRGGILLSHILLLVASALIFGQVKAPAWGQNVAQPPSAGETTPGANALQEPIIVDSESLPPAVTVERHGRLLVLTCGSKPAGGVLSSNVSPRGVPPRFTVSQGQRQIASGQFEHG